jgi:hypothetical protein
VALEERINIENNSFKISDDELKQYHVLRSIEFKNFFNADFPSFLIDERFKIVADRIVEEEQKDYKINKIPNNYNIAGVDLTTHKKTAVKKVLEIYIEFNPNLRNYSTLPLPIYVDSVKSLEDLSKFDYIKVFKKKIPEDNIDNQERHNTIQISLFGNNVYHCQLS